MIPKECSQHTTDSNVKVTEKKSTAAIFSNAPRSQFTVIRFDGCVIKQSTACDFIVEKQAVGRLAVELKGCDVAHATEQVEVALNYLKENGKTDLPIGALIVCTRVPSNDTTVQRMQQKLAKKFRARLTVRTNGSNLDFDSLVKL